MKDLVPSNPVSRRVFGVLVLGTAVSAAAKQLLPGESPMPVSRRPTPDLVELQRKFAELTAKGGGDVRLDPGRVYDIGDVASPQHVFLLRDLKNVAIDGQGAKIVMRSRGLGQNQIFLMQGCSGVTIRNLSAEDHGTKLDVDWQGANFFYVECSYGPSRDILIDNCSLDSGVSFLTCDGVNEVSRTTNLTVRNSRAANVYYGISFQENGDHCSLQMQLKNCRRAYYVYGVRDHQADLQIAADDDALGSTACILVYRYTRDTSGVRVRARFTGNLPWSSLSRLGMHADDDAAPRIEDVQIVLDTRGHTGRSAPAYPLAVSAEYGPVPQPVSNGVWSRVRLAGWFSYAEAPVRYLTLPAKRADITVDPA